MNRDEYNKLFHKVGLNRVAFKAVNDCDEEVLKLVNEAIAAERLAITETIKEEMTDELEDEAYHLCMELIAKILKRGQA
jgi:hypothetical protein